MGRHMGRQPTHPSGLDGPYSESLKQTNKKKQYSVA